MPALQSIAALPAFSENSQLVNIVIDTPQDAHFKLKYDEAKQIFRVHKALPVGLAFPFNFGFVPSTVGGDGDALDVLVLASYAMPTGAVVLGKLLSVLLAEQVENRQKQRNDRLIAVPIESVSRKKMQPGIEFNSVLKTAIIDFFVHYNQLQGKTFRPLGYASAHKAIQTVRNCISK
jgi:inorganic pyrophosphatase